MRCVSLGPRYNVSEGVGNLVLENYSELHCGRYDRAKNIAPGVNGSSNFRVEQAESELVSELL